MSALGGRSSIIVTDTPRRITAPHGISARERDLLTEGIISLRRKGPLAFISLEAGTAPDAEPIVRTQSRKVKSDIGLYQRRAGMRRAPLCYIRRPATARQNSVPTSLRLCRQSHKETSLSSQ